MAGGLDGFKHRGISILLRMISEVLNFCDKVMNGDFAESQNGGALILRLN